MKYYLIEISDGDSKIKGKSIYEYATKEEAEANFHKKLGVAMASELYTEETILVVDSNGLSFYDLVKHFIRPSAPTVEE